MEILPFQNHVAARMLVNTDGETIAADALFARTANGYWIAWQYDGRAALLPPGTPEGEPCFWVEGAADLAALAALVEQGAFDALDDDLDGGDDVWEEAGCGCGCHHGHG
ncbi:MAG: general secretion pathway protein GspG [Neisseria sp.]|nr:general secretion pathway protein GspG [Neisseria sp.]